MMSDLDKLLITEPSIPFEKGAAWFVAIKQASDPELEKQARTMRPGEIHPDEVAEAKARGYLSGVRGAVRADITKAQNIRRTRGARVGKEVGTLGGAALGALLGGKGGAKGRVTGAALGALLGRGAGKSVGEEVDLSRIKGRFRKKKAEMTKESADRVARVRELAKQAEGGYASSPAEAGYSGVQNEYGPVEMGQLPHKEKNNKVPAPPNKPNKAKTQKPSAVSPEAVAKQQALDQISQDAQLDDVQQANEADFFRAKAEEASVAAEQMGAQLQEAQQAIEQMGQQAQMAQQQADAAVQQSAMQAQQAAMQNNQLAQQLQVTQQAAMGAQQQNMQIQQAMNDYRQQLQQLVLQDPIAAVAPPAMGQPGMVPEEQAAAEEQAALEEQGGVPAEGAQEASPAPEGGAPLVAINQGGAEPAKPKPKAKPKSESKEKTSSLRQRLLKCAAVLSQGQREDLSSKQFAVPASKAKKIGVAGEIQGEAKGKYPIPDEKHARNALARVSQHGTPAEREAVRKKVYAKYPHLREGFEERHGESPTSKENVKKEEQGGIGKTSSLKQRLIGAGIGAGLGAGVQSVSDLKGKGGVSTKERVLRAKLKELEGREGKGALDKHRTTITRALADTAKTNREHPRSAAIMAALTGAAAGAALAPRAGKLLKRVAARGGR